MENRRLKLENRAYQTNLETWSPPAPSSCARHVELERSYDITWKPGRCAGSQRQRDEGIPAITAFTIAIAGQWD